MKQRSFGTILTPIEWDEGISASELPGEFGWRQFQLAELQMEPPLVRAWLDTEKDEL